MKKIVIIIFLVLVLTSCRQTPDSSVIISKKNIEYVNNNEQTNNLEGTPEHWEATYNKYNGRFKMSIDADIIIPDAEKIQVADIKPYYISSIQADKIISTIFGTLDVGFCPDELSREQIEEVIITAKADQQVALNNNNEEEVEELQLVIDELYAILEEAPDYVEIEKYNGVFDEYKDETGYEESHISVRKNPLERDSPILEIYNLKGSAYDNGYSSSVLFYDIDREAYNYGNEENRNLLYSERPECNTEDAEKAVLIANEYLSNMGIEDRILEDIVPRVSSENSDEITSYLLIYGKNYNDIPIKIGIQFGGTAINNTSEENYIPPFSEEALYIEIQDEEIVYLSWSNFYSVKDILYDNVYILPFEDIMETAETQLAVKYAFIKENKKPYSLYVDKIVFSYAVEPIADTEFEYMLIPVWGFYGGYDFGKGVKQSSGKILKGKYREQCSLLTISAIDGSVIFGQ